MIGVSGLLTIACAAQPSSLGVGPYVDVSTSVIPVGATASKSSAVAITDVTGDGVADIVVACRFAPNVLLVGGDGPFTYARGAFGAFALRDSSAVAVGDVDGDGLPDVVFASEADRVDELFLGDGDGSFADKSDRIAGGAFSRAVLIADVDDDDDSDVLIGGGGPFRALLNDGGGVLTRDDVLLPQMDGVAQAFATGDVDGDGDVDLVIGCADDNRLFVNAGGGRYVDESAERLILRDDGSEDTRDVGLFDVDGDGDLDLFFANAGRDSQANPRNRLLINDGTGWFTDESEARLPTLGVYTQSSAFGDLDGDGDLDLVLGNATSGFGTSTIPVQVWVNDGKGVFEDVTVQVVPRLPMVSAADVAIADLNGDGTLDIYVANQSGADRVLVKR